MRRPHGDGYRNAHTGSCQFPLQQICGYNVAPTGWVTEWLIVHAWKACVPKGTGGSNPPPSVSLVSRARGAAWITGSDNNAVDFQLCSALCADVVARKFARRSASWAVIFL